VIGNQAVSGTLEAMTTILEFRESYRQNQLMHSLTPIFAEIADKMPTLATIWAIWLLSGLIGAAVTAGLSLVRLWLGAIVVLVSVAIGLLAAWPSSFDEHIIRELGVGYLWQQRIAGFIPCMLAAGAWITVRFIRRRRTDMKRGQ
jgi:hypothetical protein